MQKRRWKFWIALVIIVILGAYPTYRIYHVWQLNLQLERFMAQQIITLQEKSYSDEWFKSRNLVKPTEYFVYRSEAYYIYKNWFIKEDIDRAYQSYWISQTHSQRKVSPEEWNRELHKYKDGTLGWTYQIRPVSGSVVCIMVTALTPRSWTAGMGSLTGVSVWSLDISKESWQLEPYYNKPCEFRDTELLRTALWDVQ